jgi:hypothetical protein
MGSANSASIADETISPELVLVDPELRRRVLADLLQNDAFDALAARSARQYPQPPHTAVEQQRAPTHVPRPIPEEGRRRLSRWPRALRTPAVLPGLVGLSVFVALGVSEARVNEPTLGPAPPAGTSAATKPLEPPTANAKSTAPARGARSAPSRSPRRRTPNRETRTMVERKVLAAVIQAPAGKLPRRLIDSRTGLAKNGLQAVCRPTASPGSFLCLVRPARHQPHEGLFVRYTPRGTGGGALSWQPYRSS